MPHEPKKRHSRARQGKRRADLHLKLKVTKAIICPNCGAQHISHHVCAACGFYKGQQILKAKQPSVSQA